MQQDEIEHSIGVSRHCAAVSEGTTSGGLSKLGYLFADAFFLGTCGVAFRFLKRVCWPRCGAEWAQ